MQIPQPRPYAEAKKSTQDFLSLYSDPSFHQHQDPRPPPPSQGMYLKTHDFLQVSKRNTISEATNEMPTTEKPQSVEHVLPGGIGTYTISQSSNHGTVKPERNVCSVAHPSVNERKVEPRRATNGCSPFTLWEESVVKEKVGEQFTPAEPAEKLGQWPSSERPSPPFAARAGGGFAGSLPSSKQQKSRVFMDMMRSSKGGPEEDDDDDEEFTKKEGSSQRGDGGGKGDAKGGDPKAATPRSKHSATEQRRRSKINDRFQVLRELIPNSDQKRDKASFLLEVIEYIQFLQEKVHKYESAYPGWNQESAKKLVPWKHSQGPGEGMPDHPHLMKNGPVGGILSGRKFDDNSVAVPPAVVAAAHQFIESVNAGAGVPHHHPGLAGKVVSVPLQQQQQQPGMHPSAFVRSGGGLAQVPQRSMSDVENMTPQWHRPCTTEGDNNITEQEEMTIEGGTIRISSVYSRGLMSSLTHALQNSGIDLSQASVSVQIDLGKRALRPTACSGKDQEEPSSSNRAMAHSRAASSGEDSDPAQKRPRFDSS